MILPLICIVSLTSLWGCGLDSIARAIDNAITELEKASGDWQNITDKLLIELKSIPGQLSATIHVDVQNLVSEGIAETGEEVRCDMDIIGLRMADALKRIANDKIYHSAHYVVGPLIPIVCHAIPDAIDRTQIPDHLNELVYSGEDFDSTCVKLYLQKSDGTQEDITDFLSITTNYHMTVNLGTNGVQLDRESSKIILMCDTTVLSTVPIIQGTIDYTIPETTLGRYFPPLVSGDREFDGHGPHILVKVNLTKSDYEIDCTVYMYAQETQSNWSTAYGSQTTPIYNAPSGYYIQDILNIPISDSYEFTYTVGSDGHEHDPVIVPRGASGLVKDYTIWGDGPNGNDIGTWTSVQVELNDIPIVLAQE